MSVGEFSLVIHISVVVVHPSPTTNRLHVAHIKKNHSIKCDKNIYKGISKQQNPYTFKFNIHLVPALSLTKHKKSQQPTIN